MYARYQLKPTHISARLAMLSPDGNFMDIII
jgi:hypothetical protein